MKVFAFPCTNPRSMVHECACLYDPISASPVIYCNSACFLSFSYKSVFVFLVHHHIPLAVLLLPSTCCRANFVFFYDVIHDLLRTASLSVVLIGAQDFRRFKSCFGSIFGRVYAKEPHWMSLFWCIVDITIGETLEEAVLRVATWH